MNEANKISTYIHNLVGAFIYSDAYERFMKNLDKQKAIGPIVGFTNYQINKFAYLETAVSEHLNKSYADTYSTVHDWLHSKVIYTFDPEIRMALDDTRWSDIREQPISLLNRIPIDYFVVYLGRLIQLGEQNFDFFVCMIERHPDDIGLRGIHFVFGNSEEDGRYVHVTPCGIKVDSYSEIKTIGEVYHYNCENHQDINGSESKSELKRMFRYVFPYILYLCSQNAEISQTPDSIQNYRTPSGQPKNKYSEIKEYKCGESTGEKIRKFKNANPNYCGTHNSGSGSRKSPHIRRAHYHRFWIGHGENKTQVIRWLPPMVIHPEVQQDIKPTVVKVTQ